MVKTFDMPVFLWGVGVCKDLIQVVFLEELADFFGHKLRTIVTSDFNSERSFSPWQT